MIDGMLTKDDVAAQRGVPVTVISRYLTWSKARRRKGLPLRNMDIPIEDKKIRHRGHVRPVWRPDGPIAVWIAHGAWVTTAATQTEETR